MKNSRNSKFITDIFIYGFGNLGSKMITFLLIPLYTYYIKPEEYGYYDITLNMIFLMIPFVTLQLRDGVFRFLLDNDDDNIRINIITFTYKFLLQTTLIVLLIAVITPCFISIPYIGWIAFTLIFMSFYEVQMQIVRGTGNNKYFVIASIMTAFSTAGGSVLCIVVFNMGIAGIFCASILARTISIIIIEQKLHLFKKYFYYNFKNKELNRSLINYSLPLLPNIICCWLISSSNRFYIEHFLGLEENGIYAVAAKFTCILENFTVIIYQAWQETAIKQYKSTDKNNYFSKILNTYILVLSLMAIFLVFILKMNYSWLVSPKYLKSVAYLYPLSISVIFYALASFLDMGYQCYKQTVKTLPSIIMTALLNMLLNYLFIKEIGIYGIIYSSIISYMFLFIYRLFDTRKYFVIHLSLKIAYPIFLLLSGSLIYYKTSSIIIQSLYLLIIIIFSYLFLEYSIKNKIRKLCKLYLHFSLFKNYIK